MLTYALFHVDAAPLDTRRGVVRTRCVYGGSTAVGDDAALLTAYLQQAAGALARSDGAYHDVVPTTWHDGPWGGLHSDWTLRGRWEIHEVWWDRTSRPRRQPLDQHLRPELIPAGQPREAA